MLISLKKFSVFGLFVAILSFLPLMAQAQQQLPLPRMVSLRAEEVNVRTGPGVQYPVKWIFKAKAMPVEIIAEYDTWRKIRDSEGEEGWIHRAMLTGKRALVIIDAETKMMEDPIENSAIVARLAMGIVAEIDECNSSWCHVNTRGYDGWVARTAVWGVYPHEVIQ
ncbi:SH3 domain-containing protein [Curvivirga sp.]|uniref:SH3 domain-containing protein n=1 Tax=Curvivirga sp. TaxID=2856848 RepID=UPI003B5B4338